MRLRTYSPPHPQNGIVFKEAAKTPFLASSEMHAKADSRGHYFSILLYQPLILLSFIYGISAITELGFGDVM